MMKTLSFIPLMYYWACTTALRFLFTQSSLWLALKTYIHYWLAKKLIFVLILWRMWLRFNIRRPFMCIKGRKQHIVITINTKRLFLMKVWKENQTTNWLIRFWINKVTKLITVSITWMFNSLLLLQRLFYQLIKILSGIWILMPHLTSHLILQILHIWSNIKGMIKLQ